MPTVTVPSTVRALATQLAEPRPMRRGSVSERFVKCNRPGCLCTERPDARHGPYYSLSRVVNGKTRSRWLSAEQAAVVRAQVAVGRQLRQQVDAYWDVCEHWADTQVTPPEAASREAVKKGASKKPSTSKSSPKSTRS